MEPSAFHRLGTQRLLALVFENGRKRVASMTIRSEELEQLFKTWHRLLATKKEIETMRRTAESVDIVFERWMVDRDKDLHNGCHNFLRVLSSLATFGGAPDLGNQFLLLTSLVKEAGASANLPRSQSKFALIAEAHRTSMAGKKMKTGKAANLADLSPSTLNLIVNICRGAARSDAHKIYMHVPALNRVLGRFCFIACLFVRLLMIY